MSREMNKMALDIDSPLLALLLEMAAKEGEEIIESLNGDKINARRVKPSTKVLSDHLVAKHNHHHAE